MGESLEEYKNYVSQKLSRLNSIFAKAAIGDFSEDLELTQEDDEFTQLYAGIAIMLDVIRDKIDELQEDNERLKILINSLPIGIYISEVPSGKPLLTNKKAEELLGRRLDSSIGIENYTHEYAVVDTKDRPYPKDEHPIAITVSQGKPAMKDDIVIKRNDGSKIRLKVQSVPILSSDRKLKSVLAVFDDITREKELEMKKTEFVSLASHKLRTPLGTIRWNLEMILNNQKGELSEELKQSLQDVANDNQRMINLVNDLLSVARLEQGIFSINPQEVNISQIINEAIENVSPSAQEMGITINQDVNQDLTMIVDYEYLLDVLINLLQNAITYNKDSGTVAIKAYPENENIVISIADTGIGIRQEDLGKIFTKFYRTKEANEKNADGSGLGLFMVKQYIQGWGGNIKIDTKYGEGTTITLTIPKNTTILSIENEVAK